MTKIYRQITDLIGHTPLVELSKYSKFRGVETPVIAKIEYFNPGGSEKDRIAWAMIEEAEKAGKRVPRLSSRRVATRVSGWLWWQP